MAGLSPREYQRILDLTTAILDSGSTYLPWQLVAAQLRTAIPSEASVLFWSQGWIDAPPDDFPMPYPRDAADSLSPLVDRALAEHPLVRHYQAAEDRVPRTLSELRDAGRWSDPDARDAVRTVLPVSRHLALPLPAPPGQDHLILLGRDGSDFTAHERELAVQLQPLLAAVVNQQRSLLRWYATRSATGQAKADAGEHRLTPREQTVLILLGDTLTAAAIARRLSVSPRTVHKHLESIYRKLGTRDRLATILYAQTTGLIPVRRSTR